MRKLTVMLGLLLFLVACQNKTSMKDTQNPAKPSLEVTIKEAVQNEEVASPTELQDIPPVYIDEANYTGDELEIVKLMNARLRYIWEEDEKGYMSLIDSQSPVSGMTRTKVRKIVSISDIIIREQRKLYEGVVTVTELDENDDESSLTMVFWKKKEEGDSEQWIIADID
ncbi:hypothetical protein [Paenibacillus illinoisensis]|uniref:hypothetical protein n=1 Tax=Paenibacillus illinoisensis TaxID=59845 RepID=UPI00203D2B8E|nr:hypothetical protein [Paenibacillus illinoisensis]MCM3204837.1 hypothetical protein [Paenibacillus illinoisensis]